MLTLTPASTEHNHTPSQRRVIEFVHGQLVCLSGFGTGKTETMAHRHARLIRSGLAWYGDVLTLTFTRQAADQMRQRVQELLGEDVENLPIGTFHSRLLLILQNEADQKKPYRVYDEEQAYRLLLRAMEAEDVPPSLVTPELAANEISLAKDRFIPPERYPCVEASPASQAIARIYARYQQLLDKEHALDFDDLTLKATLLIESNTELRAQLRQQHRFVQVDEWQDTSLSQYRFLRALVGPEGNLVCVGSVAQSIYEWRQANYERLMNQFQIDYPNAQTIVLRENFRSTHQIVQAACCLLDSQRYPDTDLVPMNGAGKPVQDVRMGNEHDEAAFIATEARRLHEEQGLEWHEMSVLFRSNTQSKLIEHALLDRGIPYYLLTGARSIYDQRDVRALFAYLALGAGKQDAAWWHEGDLLGLVINTPSRGIGPVSQRRIKGDAPSLSWELLMTAAVDEAQLPDHVVNAVQQLLELLWSIESRVSGQTPPAEVIEHVLEATDWETWLVNDLYWHKRMAAIRDFQEEACQHPAIADLLDAIHEKRRLQNEFFEGEGIALSTIHTAKGLQWPVVFVAGMNEGVFPHVKSLRGQRIPKGHAVGRRADPPEERRLAHVAFSRAGTLLYLLSAQHRIQNNRPAEMRVSRYLRDLPIDVVQRRNL